MVEVNEAFASVALQFMRDAGLEERWADVNPNGGGISLERRDARYGVATMCIGFGQAIAAVIERV